MQSGRTHPRRQDGTGMSGIKGRVVGHACRDDAAGAAGPAGAAGAAGAACPSRRRHRRRAAPIRRGSCPCRWRPTADHRDQLAAAFRRHTRVLRQARIYRGLCARPDEDVRSHGGRRPARDAANRRTHPADPRADAPDRYHTADLRNATSGVRARRLSRGTCPARPARAPRPSRLSTSPRRSPRGTRPRAPAEAGSTCGSRGRGRAG